MKITLEHQAHDGLASIAELAKNFASDEALAPMIPTGIIMRTVDHDGARNPFAGDRRFSPCDMLLVVVGFPPAPAQHDVSVRIAHRFDDRRLSIGIDANKMMRGSCSGHGVDGNLQTAFRAIFEAHWHRNAAR